MRIATFFASMLLASVNAGAGAAGPADMAAVSHFKLTGDFLKKWESYQELAAEKPCQLSPMVLLKDQDEAQSLDQAIGAFDAKPGVHAALSKVGLTAREAILGMSALMGAAMKDMAAQHPGMMETDDDGPAVSPQNLAFYRQHKDELHSHQMKLAREQLKRNGGKLPACLMGG
ncbi:hypothetical protein PVT67_03120 [Gallaecimonas kandeliae]|uniref:hypothetical protein n=1 Tax=Gallaecimonas kandeliae TaxID=3029055 RepID=UPI002647BBB8|nr:hypothetical protein [Gallaecimonas kandeliae]WKE66255.1 hypothetical protein PVT67_03120 [Gallaecimonas kandeliae]